MKKHIYIPLIIIFAFTNFSCKKFLNIVPVDALSGNNFWQNKKDVETFTNGLYASLRVKMGNGTVSLADMRCAPIVSSNNFANLLANNNLRSLISNGTPTNWRSAHMTQWKPYYDIISSANLLFEKIDEVPAEQLGESDRKRYKAEAVFMRNFCYFMLLRIYGDVPYYTNAFNEEPLPRTPMLQVINKCIDDMAAVKNDLPWTYADPTLVGVRAMRGSAIALLMHLNMWGAGFDAEVARNKYYNEVKTLGTELFGATDYGLLPYTAEDSRKIFKGRTKESLFEIYQNFNIGERLSAVANVGSVLAHYPYLGAQNYTTSLAYYKKDFMDRIYNDANSDIRKDLWFENRSAGNNTFQFKKFANVFVNGVTVQNDDNLIIFRLSDAYLLAAEAHAELGDDNEAMRLANIVRLRAGASDFKSTGTALKEDIYWERVRELMGEGHYYYDLVRTKKLTDSKFADIPVTVTAFNSGAWTWPIDASALLNNPNMNLNDYWR